MEIPWIIPVSGTSKDDVKSTLERICEGRIEPEEVFELHQIHSKNSQSHSFRGFSVVSQNQAYKNQILIEKTTPSHSKSRPVWFIFNGMGTQWAGMGESLMQFQTCKNSLEKSAIILKAQGLDLLEILLNGKEDIFENVLVSFVSIAAIQIALVDLLSSLKIKPDGIVGHSVGELGAAYADDCLTAEQVILTAHARGKAILEMGAGDGAMAAVGLSWEESKKKCPAGVYPACHNSKDSVTVSGPAKLIHDFVDQLQKQGTFARKVNSSNQAFHSKFIQPAKFKFKESLDKIIPVPKPRSNRWISSSIPESQWNLQLAKNSSADYHANNLISPVLFQEALEKVPASSVVIEIGPHCLLQAILKRSLSNCSHVGLLNKNHKDNSTFLCNSIGKMFNFGLNPAFGTLYTNQSLMRSISSWDKSGQKPSNSADALVKTAAEKEVAAGTGSGQVWSLHESESTKCWLFSIAQVLGMEIQDLEENSHQEFQLLGMDSFMRTEIKQMVQIKCGHFLSDPELRQLSFNKLLHIVLPHKSLKGSGLNPSDSQQSGKNTQNGNNNEALQRFVGRGPQKMAKREKEIHNTICQKLAFLTVYVFSFAFACFVACIFLPVGLIFRLCVQIYLCLFYGTRRSQIQLMTGLLEELCFVSNANTVHVLKFSGTPDRAKFVNILENRMNFNILRAKTKGSMSFQHSSAITKNENSNKAGAGFDKSIERLRWGVQKHWLFMCWIRDPDFNAERHVIWEETTSSSWDGDMTQLAQHYHNLNWDKVYPDSKLRPRWEIRIVHSKQLQEFILCFAWNHAYGDGQSFVNLVQSWMADECENADEFERPNTFHNPDPAQASFFSRKLGLVRFGLVKVLELICLAHFSILALAKHTLDCWGAGRRDLPAAKMEDHNLFSVGQFRLSTLKSIKDQETERPFNLNAVVLYIIANVIERVIRDSRRQPQEEISSSRPLLGSVTWSPFENENGHLFVGNNMVGTFTPVPSRKLIAAADEIRDSTKNAENDKEAAAANVVSDDGKNLQLVQKSLRIASESGFLAFSHLLARSVSLYPYPVVFPLTQSFFRQNFTYTNVVAPFPTNMACFGGHQLKDVYAFAIPLPMLIVGMSNSFNDSLNITMSLSKNMLKNTSPHFHHRFFEYFQQEIDNLVKSTHNVQPRKPILSQTS